MNILDVNTQIIGCGVASLGIVIAADNDNKLHKLLNSGLVYIEKTPSKGWQSLNYDINSNSGAYEFIEAMNPKGCFHDVFSTPEGQNLEDKKEKYINLKVVSRFFKKVSDKLAVLMEHYPNSNILYDKSVKKIVINQDSTLESYDSKGGLICQSNNVILASGCIEREKDEIDNPDVMVSSEVISEQKDTCLLEAITSNKKIVIYGGSHSALSCASYLLKKFNDSLDVHQIVIRSRSKVKEYNTTLKSEERKARYQDNDILSHRFSGLRADSLQLYRKILDGEETRVKLLVTSDKDIAVKPFQISIIARGYKANILKVYSSQGDPIELLTCRDKLVVDKNRNLLDKNKQPIKGFFGLGHAVIMQEEMKLIEHNNQAVGVNIYHNFDTPIIVNQLI